MITNVLNFSMDDIMSGDAVRLSYADNTKRSYDYEFRMLSDRLRNHDLDLAPTAFCYYLKELYLQEKPYSRMSTARSALLAHRPEVKHHPDFYKITNTMKTFRRADPTQPKQATPITWDEITFIRYALAVPRDLGNGKTETFRTSTARAHRMHAHMLLLFWCALRFSESANVEWSDIEELSNGTGRVTIKRSKTSVKPETVPIAAPAMKAISQYREFLGYHDMTGLKRYRRPFVPKRNCFCELLNQGAELAGIEKRFSSHSFRVGATLFMEENGVDELTIQQTGRWKKREIVNYYTRKTTTPQSARTTLHACKLPKTGPREVTQSK